MGFKFATFACLLSRLIDLLIEKFLYQKNGQGILEKLFVKIESFAMITIWVLIRTDI